MRVQVIECEILQAYSEGTSRKIWLLECLQQGFVSIFWMSSYPESIVFINLENIFLKFK